MDATLVRVVQPRCPFCHDDVGPGPGQAPCVACRAWHHAECWAEGGGCAACGARERRVVLVAPARPARDGSDLGWTIALWGAAAGGLLTLDGCVLPAFWKMFREVGVCLPPLTEAVFSSWRWVLGLGLLSLLHASALAGPVGRGRLRVGAFGLAGLGLLLLVWALFLPLIELNQRL